MKYLGLEFLSQVEPFLHQEEKGADFMMDDIMKVGNFGRRLRKDEEDSYRDEGGMPICRDYIAGSWGSGVADGERQK